MATTCYSKGIRQDWKLREHSRTNRCSSWELKKIAHSNGIRQNWLWKISIIRREMILKKSFHPWSKMSLIRVVLDLATSLNLEVE